MKLYVDTHTHTVASTHAYSTIQENARAAADRGLKILAITDHAPAIDDSPHKLHFMGYHALEKSFFGVQMLYGAELNILDYDGSLDLDESIYERLDICIASFHDCVVTPGSRKENTRAMVKAMQQKYVAILGHPDDGKIPVDYEELVLEAKSAGVLLEVNNASLKNAFYRVNARENIITMLKLCEKHGVMVSIGTDAHAAGAVGNMDNAVALMEEIGFPEELVINAYPEAFIRHLENKK